MTDRRNVRWILALPVASVALLELVHPSWPDDAVYETVAPIVGWWITLHLLLVALFPVVMWTLWLELQPARNALRRSAAALLAVAAVSSTAYLALDGLGTGLMVEAAQALDPAGRHAVAAALVGMWTSPLVTGLVDTAGGSLALALLCTATALFPAAWNRSILSGLVITGAALILSAFAGGSLALLVSRAAGLFTGGMLVYRTGASAVPFALLVFAATLPQHVGPPAALGMLLIQAALCGRWFVRGEVAR